MPIHSAAKQQIADGSLERLRSLYQSNQKLAAELERRKPWRKRARRGWKKAHRNGWRLHRYPRDFWRGLHATGSAKRARSDIETLKKLTQQQKHEEAIAYSAALLPLKTKDKDKDFLETALKVFKEAGALSLQLKTLVAINSFLDNSRYKEKERNVRASIVETEPKWLPSIGSVPSRIQPVKNRVLHVLKASIPYRQSGYTMRSQYIIDSQRAAGLDPAVLMALGFPEQLGVTDAPLVQTLKGTEYHHLVSDTRDIHKRPADLYLDAYAEKASARAAELAPSLIHVHSGHRGYEAALVGIAVARALHVPLVYEVRGFFDSLWSADLKRNESGERFRRRLDTDTRCMEAADVVTTLSESMKAEIIARGVDPKKVFVVPNGVDTNAFRPSLRSEELVEKYDLDGKSVFGYVSNLDHFREGHEVLIRTAAILRAQGVPAVAMIIGDGKRRGELEALAKQEKAEDAVVFTGKVPHDEVLDYYRLLDVFVVPRVPERAARLVTPLKPFEAMAAGVPVVVSELDALMEITGDGERGKSFKSGDSESLAKILASLFKDNDMRDDLSKRGRDWVEAERQWSSTVERYNAAYHVAYSRFS